jgi:DNA-binding transcriptional LysR family regulator
MSHFDWLDLDAKLLRLLVTVVDTGSVTGAAQRLGVTQSAVSHLLDKLRGITGDVLFAKSGRGIVATARAEALAERARALLGDLERFAYSDNFDPGQWRTTFTIAANDFQRDALLPALMQRLREQAPGVSLRVIPSEVPTPEMLRQEHCQLIISPRPPDGVDMMQKRLFSDRYRVFYDPAVRAAPSSKKDYLTSSPWSTPPTGHWTSMHTCWVRALNGALWCKCLDLRDCPPSCWVPPCWPRCRASCTST